MHPKSNSGKSVNKEQNPDVSTNIVLDSGYIAKLRVLENEEFHLASVFLF